MVASSNHIRALRERILGQMLRWATIVSLVPCVAGVVLAIQLRLWPVVVLDSVGWLLLAVLSLHPGLSYQVRAAGLLVLLGGLGLGLLLILGPFGVGLIWLLGVTAVAGVLFGARVFWLTLAAVLLGIFGVALGEAMGAWSWVEGGVPLPWWIMAAFSVACVSLLVGVSTTAMMARLQRTVHQIEWERRRVILANELLQDEIARRQQAEDERAALQEQVALAQKMELVGQLAGGVAHDLNNLLTVVRVEGDMARDEAPAGSDLAEGLDNLLDATNSAAALCTRLLLFARPQRGERLLLEADELVASALGLLASLAGERVRVLLDLAGKGALVLVDPVQMEQVLTNLVANARDAMPQGGEVRIATRKEIDRAGGHLVIEVSDDGVGMSAATARRVFEPFFTTKFGRGTGLGLATVYAIVHSLDGRIDVRSSPGEGATFVIRLPMDAQAELPEVELPVFRTRLPPGETTVWLVEDNPSVRQVAERVLSAVGCVVWTAETADDALAVLESLTDPPHLLLTDVLMPGRSGVELADALRRRFPQTPILAMTGWLGDGELAGRLQELRVPVLRKPFSPAELVDAVAEHLANEATGARRA